MATEPNQINDAVRSLSAEDRDKLARTLETQALEAKGFKPVPSGFTYQSPKPWGFGHAEHHLVTEAEMEKILSILAPTRSDKTFAVLATAVAAAITIVLAGAWLPPDFLSGQSVGRTLFSIGQGAIPVAVGFLCLRVLPLRRLQPFLVDLPRSGV